jgi:hypothetical protein
MSWQYDGTRMLRPLGDALWVTLTDAWSDGARRWVIGGNSHTHPGRFTVYATVDGEDMSLTVSIDAVADASPEARIWLDGYLCGYEPDPYDFAPDPPERTDEDDRLWLEYTQLHYRQGWTPTVIPSLPIVSPTALSLADPPAWTFRYARWWVLQDGNWVVAEPQPAHITATNAEDFGWSWPGSSCDIAEEHDPELTEMVVDVLGDGTALETFYCAVCHEISSVSKVRQDE